MMNNPESLALDLARQAGEDGDVPVGAVIVDRNGKIIGRGRNRRESARNALAHAEIEAINEACNTLGGWRLPGTTMYVTMKPCQMCEGAVFNARIENVVIVESKGILDAFFVKLRERKHMYDIQFIAAKTESQLERTAEIAHEIWNEWFPPIIGQAQTDYMIERFQSLDAMKEQIASEHYEYFILQKSGTDIGYTAVADKGDGRLFLSKAYIKKAYRGKGYFRQLLAFISEIARERDLRAVWLTVNRGNTLARMVYEKTGFVIIGEGVTDIGDGFVMDDYYYELSVSGDKGE
jgi:tRNA(Arg) A34 adenosine deaminase TadA/GNAT superfamily N-acetyltransferase